MNLNKGGKFLFEEISSAQVFTREDISKAQQMVGAVAEEFMRREVLTRAEQIYGKEWDVTRGLLLKAGDLDLLRLDIPENYGGLGLDKVSSDMSANRFLCCLRLARASALTRRLAHSRWFILATRHSAKNICQSWRRVNGSQLIV